MKAYKMTALAAILVTSIAGTAIAQGMAAPAAGGSMSKTDGMASKDAMGKDSMGMDMKKKPMKKSAMKGDAMKGDAMKGDAMKGDAMKGDSMAAPSH